MSKNEMFDSIVPALLDAARSIGFTGDLSHHAAVNRRNQIDPIRLSIVGESGTSVYDGRQVHTLSLGRECVAGHKLHTGTAKTYTPRHLLGAIKVAEIVAKNPDVDWGKWSGRSFIRGVGKKGSEARRLIEDAGVKILCSDRGNLLFSYAHKGAEAKIKDIRSRYAALRGANKDGSEMNAEQQETAISARLAKGKQQKADAETEAERRKAAGLVPLPKALVKSGVLEAMKSEMATRDLSIESADDVGEFLALAITQLKAATAIVSAASEESSEDVAEEDAA
tara:strand:+ start:3403 stop:4245 length:843 start_codon:yes stop_codon:yes gene_type:complete